MSEYVILRREGPIAEVILNNPAKHNALSPEVMNAVLAVCAELAVDRATRVAIVHGGEAKAFCSGADLKARLTMTEPQVYDAVRTIREMVDAVEGLPMPTIAAIHGPCFGGGLELAMGCDLRIATADAQMGLTEVQWAIIPGGGGTQRLPRIVGLAKAKEMILTAARLDAATAERIGLVNQVVASREELLPAARAMAERMCEMGPLALRAAKRAVNGGQPVAEGQLLEWECYQSIIPTRDRVEALQAFAEKRKPVFRGE